MKLDIEETLNITDQISRVEASDDLKQRLNRIPSNYISNIHLVSRNMIVGTAASFALLLTLNLYTALNESKERSTTASIQSNSADAYFDYLKNY